MGDAVIASTEKIEWLRKRTRSLGASEVPALFGAHRYLSPLSLWASKTGAIDVDETDSEPARWGNLLEPVIAEEYALRTGRTLVDPGRFATRYHATHPWLSCTPDRIIKAFDERGDGNCQIKTASAFKAEEWGDGQYPLSVQVQVQVEMAVLDLHWSVIACLIGGQEMRTVEVDRDDEFIADVLLPACAEFWRLVETRTPPPADGHEATYDVLKKLHPNDDGSEKRLPIEAETWCGELDAAEQAIAKWDAVREEQRNRLRQAIGDATYGVTLSGERWSLKTDKKGSRVLRRVKG